MADHPAGCRCHRGGGSQEEEEVSLTLSGGALSGAAWCAAQLCVSLPEYLRSFGEQIAGEIAENTDGDPAGRLLDFFKDHQYADAAVRDRARRNLEFLRFAHRMSWMQEQLKELELVWPLASETTMTDRLYRQRDGALFAYRPAPADLVQCSDAEALAFIVAGEFPVHSHSAL